MTDEKWLERVQPGPVVGPQADGFLINMLRFFAEQRSYCGLFDGKMRRAAECEAIVQQTVQASVTNYDSNGKAFSFLKLSPDGGMGLVDNSTALQQLLQEGLIVKGEHEGRETVEVTDKLIMTLMGHFSRELAKQPQSINAYTLNAPEAKQLPPHR